MLAVIIPERYFSVLQTLIGGATIGIAVDRARLGFSTRDRNQREYQDRQDCRASTWLDTIFRTQIGGYRYELQDRKCISKHFMSSDFGSPKSPT